MRKYFLVSLSILLSAICQADTITLKSGQKVEGRIIEETDQYIKVDFSGVVLTYFSDEVKSVDKPASPEKTQQDSSQGPIQDKDNFKTLKVVYKISGRLLNSDKDPVMEESGTKTVYIDKENNKRREEENRETKMGSQVIAHKKTTLADGEKFYGIDSDRKEAVYMDLPYPVLGGEPTYDTKYLKGEEVVAGKKCQVFDLGTMKIWVWKGLTLKEEMNRGGRQSLEEAVNIEENVVLERELFQIPPDFKVKSMDESMAESMQSLADSMTVKKDAPLSFMEASRAIVGDVQVRAKMEEAVKNDPSLSEKQKQDTLNGMKEYFSEQDKILAPARREDGSVDMEKVLLLLSAERIKVNDALAKSTLKSLSSACETYATANQGNYPETMESFTKVDPPYIRGEYCKKLISGFQYECQLSAQGYTFIASPERLGETGTTTFTIRTGGILK